VGDLATWKHGNLPRGTSFSRRRARRAVPIPPDSRRAHHTQPQGSVNMPGAKQWAVNCFLALPATSWCSSQGCGGPAVRWIA